MISRLWTKNLSRSAAFRCQRHFSQLEMSSKVSFWEAKYRLVADESLDQKLGYRDRKD